VYLTVDQKEWNPSWIELADLVSDTSLVARKYEHDWTRLGGPYLWFRPERLGLASRLWQCELPIAGHGLPIRFCQTLFRPLLVLDRFLGSCSPSYPAGSNSPASRPSILPKTVSSDILPPASASNSGRASPAVRPSSRAVAASSATSSRFAWATSAAATNCPSCRPAGSARAALGWSGNDDNSAASSSPLASPL